MKVILLAGILALAAGIDAATNCHWGPSYWCKSREAARECQQTRYCQDNVWKGSAVSMEKSQVGTVQCTLCQIVVQIVDQKLKDNATETEIEAALDKACADLGALESTCKDLVDKYFPQIWLALIEKLDPDKVCSEIGLCTSSSPKRQNLRDLKTTQGGVAATRNGQVGGIECEVCQLIVKFAEDELKKNSTEKQVQQALDTFCTNLGILAGECKDVVDQYFPQIWDALINGLSPQEVCTKIELCSSTKVSEKFRSHLGGKSSKVGGLECDTCKIVAKKMVELINSSSTEEVTKEALLAACDYMGGFVFVCRSLVKKEWPEIYPNIVKIIAHPEQLCVFLKLCSSRSLAYKKMAPGATACDLCKLVTNFLKPYVDSNMTETKVKEAVEGACKLLPTTIAAECTSLVDQNFDLIWNLVKGEVDSDEICVQLGLCNSTKAVQLVKKTKMAPRADPCDVCKLVTSLLKPYVDSNSTETEVKKNLGEVCSLLPGDISSQCSTFVDQYFDKIWALVRQEVDSGAMCTEMGLCNSTKTVQLKVVPQATACDLCKLVASYLKPYVDSNTTETEVKAGAMAACKLLPGDAGTQCTALLDKYFNVIWDLVKAEVDSGEVCKQLKLCNSTILAARNMKKFKISPKGVMCEVCQLVSGELKTIMAKNNSEGEVQTVLKKMCSLVPGSMGNNCSKMINQYFLLGWVVMEQMVDSGTLCGYIKMCSSSSAVAYLGGTGQADDECSTCAMTVETVQNMFEAGESMAEAEKLMKAICPYMSGFAECETIIEKYLPQIWNDLQQKMVPKAICTDLKLCQSLSSVQLAAKPKLVQAGDECSVCKVVVETVQNIFDDGKTMAETEKLMEEICPYIPGFTGPCKDIIEKYLPQIWKYLEEKMDPTTICTDLKLCQSLSSVQLAAKPKLVNNVRGIVECELCTLVMKELINLLSNNDTEQDIQKALDKVCGLIPKFGNECKTLVNEYSDKIVKLILSGVAPREICKAITLCTSAARTQQLQMAGGIECTVCKEVLTVAKIAIGSHTAEAEVAKVIAKVCDIVSPGIKSECLSFISTFGPEIIQLLVKAIEPDVICRDIKLCSASSVMEPWAKTARKY